MDNLMTVNGLELADVVKMAEIFVRKGCKVTLEKTAEGLVGSYYKITVEGAKTNGES